MGGWEEEEKEILLVEERAGLEADLWAHAFLA